MGSRKKLGDYLLGDLWDLVFIYAGIDVLEELVKYDNMETHIFLEECSQQFRENIEFLFNGAVIENEFETLEYFFRNGTYFSKYGMSVLKTAISYEKPRVVEFLFEEKHIGIDKEVILIICMKDSIEFFKYFFDRGAFQKEDLVYAVKKACAGAGDEIIKFLADKVDIRSLHDELTKIAKRNKNNKACRYLSSHIDRDETKG
jgi:hypothetical protein